MLVFESQQWLPLPVEEVFRFFANPKNLPPLMPHWQKARIEESRIVAPEVDGVTEEGLAGTESLITLSFRTLPGIPLRRRWVAAIREFRWNEGFCDEQLDGPFAAWRHCHTLRSEEREVEGTLLTDRVDYRPPFGRLGALADRLVVRSVLRATFRHRHQATEQLLLGNRLRRN